MWRDQELGTGRSGLTTAAPRRPRPGLAGSQALDLMGGPMQRIKRAEALRALRGEDSAEHNPSLQDLMAKAMDGMADMFFRAAFSKIGQARNRGRGKRTLA